MDKHTHRMDKFIKAGLYLVTGEVLSQGRTTHSIVHQALEGGVRLIQLREKGKSKREIYYLACQIKRLCDNFGAILIINDHVDIALAADADGVHLGNSDLEPQAARRIFPDGIIGVSTHSMEEASRVDIHVASYYNIGPIFPTKTKRWDGDFLGVNKIPEISAICSLPFTVMGGIGRNNIEQVINAGAKTVAVVTAITKAHDPTSECRKLLKIINKSN